MQYGTGLPNKTTKQNRLVGLFGIFITVSLIFGLTGCNKEQISSAQSKNVAKSISSNEIALPEIRNNRLYFPNLDALQNFTNSLNQSQNLDDINKKMKDAGFISYNYLMNAPKEEQDAIVLENQEVNDMPDEILKTILNVNQEVQIDNVICRLQNDYGFMFEEKDRNLVTEFSALKPAFEGNETGYKDQIIVFKLNVKENITSNIRNKSISIGGYGWKTQNTRNEYMTKLYRVRGHHYATNVFFYQSVGVATYHEKWLPKKCWLFATCWDWRPWNAEDIKLDLFGSYKFTGFNKNGTIATQTINPYSIKYNIHTGNKIVHSFDARWQIGFTMNPSTGVVNSFKLPLINITLPIPTGVSTGFSLDVINCDTYHEANYARTNILSWIW